MGFLIQAWEMSQQKFTMNMKQVVTNAGDGTLENDVSVNELRQFFSMIDLHTMGRLLGECYSKDRRYKFDDLCSKLDNDISTNYIDSEIDEIFEV